MTNTITINNTNLAVKEHRGQRVVTFKDVDTLHERPDGTARKRFNDNKEHFVEGEDFYKISPSEIRTQNIMCLDKRQSQDIVFLTEFGYLMLVKSLTDKLAWQVQRMLVIMYFRNKLPQTNEIKPTQQNCTILNRTIQTLQQTQQELAQSSIDYGYILHDHEIRLDQHEEYITDLNQFKEEIKAEVKQIELLTQDAQELKAVNLIPRLSIQDVVKLDYKEFASKVHSLVIELASKRKEVAGNTYNYLYSLIYSNRGNWTDMVEAIKKQGMLGFNIENSKLIYDHLPLRKTYVKTLLAALYN